jgi:pimeloyl-ACP methyl ester carboxylesterase
VTAAPPTPFTIDVPSRVLDDLAERLGRVRWPDEIQDAGWDYGTNEDALRHFVEHWHAEYDWRAEERRLNGLPHFVTTVGHQAVHFVHQRGRGPRPIPLLLTHGWPSSFWELTKVIGPLSDPAAHGGDEDDAFDVVVLSLPGYGFSDPPTGRGANVQRLASIAHEVMSSVLGYRTYGAHGGDWGGFIASRLGYDHPGSLIGLHLTSVGATPHPDRRRDLSEAERTWLDELAEWRRSETGYHEIQATKPQTLAYGLNDSPVGLCGWILEKFRAWSDCDGVLENVFTKDELLTNVMIYWVTQTIGSACRLYYEDRHHPWRLGRDDRIAVPTGIAAFPRELVRPPREWAERVYDVTHWTSMPRGGHFPAFEQPALLVEDVRAFFRQFRGDTRQR